MPTTHRKAAEPDRSSGSQPTAIIISVTSDIGTAIAQRWLSAGWDVRGTYRTESDALQHLKQQGLVAVQCDLDSAESISAAISELKQSCPKWDALVLCPATLEPIGRFAEIDFTEWDRSIQLNFTTQLRMLHGVLETRRPESDGESPCVLFFAGGGTNNSVDRYSAYTVSKTALIKMVELLDTEIPDTRFSIIGPGWVDTKIHEETMRAGDRAGALYDHTIQTLANRNQTPMDDVLDCCDWVVSGARKVVSGRNFSVVYDRWGDEELEDLLVQNPGMYKLRREGNYGLTKPAN